MRIKVQFLLPLLLAALLTVGALAADRTIATAEDFLAFMNDASALGDDVKLTADIDLTGRVVTPIGTLEAPFTGSFDGGNHTIRGIEIKTLTGQTGLFGCTDGASFRDLTLEGAITALGAEPVAALVGNAALPLEVINVTTNVKIKAASAAGVGGIVGKTVMGKSSERSESVIKNCVNNGEILSNKYVGGIVGLTAEENFVHISLSIENCTNNASIYCSGNVIGGMLGYYASKPSSAAGAEVFTMTDCKNNGDLETSADYVGGMIGAILPVNDKYAIHMTLKNLKNTGSVATGAETPNCGGIVGLIRVSTGKTVFENWTNTHADSPLVGAFGNGSGKITLKDCGNVSPVFINGFEETEGDVAVQKKLTVTLSGCKVGTFAEETASKTVVKLTIGKAIGTVNGVEKELDAAPIIANSRTMLPVRFLAEAFGAEVKWDGATSTATITADSVKIAITIGAATAQINGATVELDSPAFIENSRTYLPVRVIADALGAAVEWDGATSTATLTK